MNESERIRRVNEISSAVVHLINNMRDISDGLYRHTYDIDTELSHINKGVIQSIEKTVNSIGADLLVSEEVVSYLENKDAETTALLEYIEEKEKELVNLKNKAMGKSKYFKMFYNGIQKGSSDE